jgi:hypothetical protein
LDTARRAGVQLSAFDVVLVLNWRDLKPWHWFSLPSAALTLCLLFWLNDLRTRLAAGARIDFMGWRFNALLVVTGLRNGLTICWIAIALYGFIALAHHRCDLPEQTRSWLAPLPHFGLAACPATAGGGAIVDVGGSAA